MISSPWSKLAVFQSSEAVARWILAGQAVKG